MKQKTFSIVFALLMSMVSNVALAYDVEIDGIYYNLNATDKTATVTKGSGYSDDMVIPQIVNYNNQTYTVTRIGSHAFYSRSSLTSITIPNSVTSIGLHAFSYCSSLTSITIPSSVTSIGDYAFYDCTSLTSITVDSGNTIFDSRGNCNAIIETASNTLLFGCMNTTIPSSVTSIGEWAFYDCTSLTSITIPNSVTCIGNSAFSGCAGLTRITIPSSVTSIGNCAFSGCANLTSVTSLIENPFPIDASVFYPTVYSQARLYVILGKKDVYAQTDGWNEFLNIKVIDPSGIGTVSRNGATPKEYYSLGGERMNGQQKGLNIIRMSDGTVRKVLSR